ncbi:MAG: flagellar motor switch protein FliN [Capsulimonadaceae bacterium]|nr:flagellar motor switch protein FliN [Capsulimonadaceae bacterium]
MSDDETLSQEALDALLAELGEADDSQIMAEVPEPEEAGQGLLVDDAGGQEQPVAAAAPAPHAPRPAESPLNLVSFDDPDVGQDTIDGFDRVQDIPLEITVELGRTKLLIRDILELGVGSIIELEKMAGEPVDLLANGLLIARGEVVVIEDNFGVRITEIITAADRSEHFKAERNANG